MGHELTKNQNGQHEFMYCGKEPWHGLGQRLNGPATSVEAIDAANLAWSVSKREMMTLDGIDCKGYSAVVRDDNNKLLSIMKDSYQPIQNIEAFAFFDSVVGTGEAVYETAGSIYEGRRVFLVAKLPSSFFATADDRIDQYLTLMNTHDGSSALRMYFTPIRVVCKNTLMASLSKMKDCVSIQHTGDIATKIKEAQDSLGIAKKYFMSFQEIVEKLVQKQMDVKLVDEFLKELFKPAANLNKAQKDEVSKQAQKKISQVKANFDCDPKNNLPGIQGTMWGFWNAIAQFADHECRSVGGNADNRMTSIMQGYSADLKQTSLEKIMSLV
ncbi:MAG: DUF932 domain-containing protein [Fibrobacterota bacterium]